MKDAEAQRAPARILVVEDTPASAKLLTDLLVSQGHDARAVASGAEALAALAAPHRLPAVFARRESVEAGGLASCGSSLRDQIVLSATYVDRILKGAKPADLPIEQPTRLELVVNEATAKALGLKIPASVLARDPEIIQ
jgi:putative ABC transport system substrate-binding protein